IDPETLEGQKQILRAILLNNIILEGIFFYSSFAHFFALKDIAKMKNVVSGVELVLIDESLRLQNGVEDVLSMLDESRELVERAGDVQDIRDVILEGTALEIEYVKHKFGDRTILGISYGELERYLKYITDRRLQELGFEQEFHINENPLRFLQ